MSAESSFFFQFYATFHQYSITLSTHTVLAFHVPVLYMCHKLAISAPHDDVIKWKHFPRNWPFVRGIPRSPVNSPHKGQRRGASMYFFYLRMNKRLNKQWWGWWFETPSRPLWCHCNDLAIFTPADALVPDCARPLAVTMLTAKLFMFRTCLPGFQWFRVTVVDQIT